jgi:hypothetical protein
MNAGAPTIAAILIVLLGKAGGSPLLQQGERRFSVAERVALPSIGL